MRKTKPPDPPPPPGGRALERAKQFARSRGMPEPETAVGPDPPAKTVAKKKPARKTGC